jgi:hypothetical protein
MQHELSQWLPVSLALVVGFLILLRHMNVSNDRRSFGQWTILSLYRMVHFFWAVARAVDLGYLEYRRIIQESRIEIENEKFFGKIVKASANANSVGEAAPWQPVETLECRP